MSTTKATPAASLSTTSALGAAIARVKAWFGNGADTSDVWQLYRMSRGSDSLRPAVISKLAAHAAS